MKYKKNLSFFFILCFIFYTFTSLFFTVGFSQTNIADVKNILLQTLLSSFFVFIGGLWGGRALLGLSSRLRIKLILFMLLPQIVPSNFFLSSLLGFFDFFHLELNGIWSVIFVHFCINIGLCSFFCYSALRTEYLALVDVKELFKIKQRDFLVALLRSGLKSRFVSLFYFLVLIHGLSFSIPLILTEKIVSFEQLLYESLIFGRSTTIFIFLMVFYFLIGKRNPSSEKIWMSSFFSREKTQSHPAWWAGVLVSVFPTCFILISLLFFVLRIDDFSYVSSNHEIFVKALIGHFQILSMGLILYVLTLLIGLHFDFTKSSVYRYFLPSAALLLFSGFLFGQFFTDVYLIGLSSFLSVFIFVSLIFSSGFQRLAIFDDVMKVFKIKDKLSLFLKNEKMSVLCSFALMSFWMGGDYVFSGSLAQDMVSFGSLSRFSLARYEIIQSQYYSILGFVFSGLYILIFMGIIYGKDIKLFFLSR